MASNLTKDQQLSAANAQYRNWLNQQIAANGGYYPTINQINEYKAGILNTGLYPNLDMGVAPPAPGVDINIAPSQFFIVGQGGDLKEDRGSGFTGQPLFTAGISDSTTLQQFTAAQDAYQIGLEQVYQTQGQELQSAAQNAKAALAAAQARVQALQAQLAADSVTDPTLQSSAALQAASSAANQKLGQEISPQRESQLSVIDQQYSDYRSSGTVIQNAPTTFNTARQEQLDRINDSYTAQSSGSGTLTPSTTNQSINAATRGATEDATPITPTQTINAATRGTTEDSASVAVQSSSDTKVYTDQTNVTGPPPGSGPGSDAAAIQNTNAKDSGSNSASILKSGAAYGAEGNSGGNSGATKSNGGGGSRENKLHSYTNYTYRLSIYAVPRTTINNIYKSTDPVTNQQILSGSVFICSDSGIGQNARNSQFPVDLTIDNLELETLVNSNSSRTRGSDVIKMKFEIIEPYTVNFLGRLQKLSAEINPQNNWSTMFFILKIDFMGYNDLGEPIKPSNNGEVIPQTTKYIPFTMINMKFSVTSSGGKYSITAIPPNALGLTALDNQIPFHVEVSGTTLNEIFNCSLKSTTTETSTETGRDRQTEIVNTTTQDTVNGGKTTVKKGLATALNANEKQKKEQQKTQQYANEYKFVFEGDIGNTEVIDPSKYFKIQGVPGTSGKDQKDINQGKVGSLVVDLQQNVFRANPGTRITDFIGSLLTVSQYMTSQYRNNANEKNPIKTWKIIPTIEFGEMDNMTNYYQRKITYYIKSYEAYGQDSVDFGQGPVSPNQIVKTYKYIYSGDNRDVLDAQIDFNMAFFELKNGVPTNYIDRDGLSPGSPQRTVETEKKPSDKFFMPRYNFTNGLANRQNIGATTVSLASISVQDLMEKLFDNRGDMIKLDFTIIGDPDWISQDYPLMNPSIIGKDPYLKSGSVNFSNACYFNFYFATPNTDYNDTTGLFNPQGNYSEFSGIYYVSIVKSNFNGGKFIQKLSNFRVRNQQEVQVNAVRKEKPSGFDAASVASNLSKPPLEAPTNSVVIPNNPRVDLVPSTNTTTFINPTPTYNITDPRVGIKPPINRFIEDSVANPEIPGARLPDQITTIGAYNG